MPNIIAVQNMDGTTTSIAVNDWTVLADDPVVTEPVTPPGEFELARAEGGEQPSPGISSATSSPKPPGSGSSGKASRRKPARTTGRRSR